MQIRLRNILMERGINVKTMADALGVDMTSIPVYDRFAPSMESMKRMADWLQIPTWELFCDCGTSSWAAFQQVVTEPLMERFARRLKELASERHLQMSMVAERAGMSKANLSLSMKRNITTTTIEKIARALEIEDKAYLLFITTAEYDAIYHTQQSTAFAHNDNSPIQTVTRAVNSAPSSARVEPAEQQLTVNNELRAEVNGMGTEPDLFTQMAEDPQVLTNGVYRYGAVRIELRDGRVIVG